ncbi:uncharacterized protein LOC126757385 [Bactrocera neohumeralis]|uniref:uncharacterized protein LOC126757385 n=1 Tax=Bactrocera neohumeralis TaxID=98809 RepID=UPI002166124B|nr:uncharacterized protein LOC126757385 [Bactrocera neohumeralis]
MNYNRRRNIFTLGDFHQYPNPTHQIKAQHNRRQNSDPFERDPFKIQSYNFRYAERPSYPLPNLYNNRVHSTPSTSNKRFETFFYNYDFTPSVHDKENPPANKFREFRRRKFLLDHQPQNPTTAGQHAATADNRESSSLQQTHMYQQLHPIANATVYARVGTSASQTAIASAARTAATAAATAATTTANAAGRTSQSRLGYERLRGGNVDNGGGVGGNRGVRHYQTLCSATDTSSIGTAAGLRYGRDNVSTSSHMSGQNKYARKTNARSTGNREYLRALATAHINESANQPNYLGRGRCNSRTSVERGRRPRLESLGSGSGFAQGNSTLDASHGNAKTAGFRELSSAGTSPTKYARQPIQIVHSASPNRVTATVEKTEGACSGCQININIKGLDSTQLGDNVVIKIESDKLTPSKTNTKTEHTPVVSTLNNIYNGTGCIQSSDIAFAKLVEIKRNSEMNHNLDIKPKAVAHQARATMRNTSSSSFVIDKRLSKFAVNSTDEREQRKHKPRSSSHSRIPLSSSTARALGFTSSNTALRNTNSTEVIQRAPRSISKERMPSMVPWCLDTTLRHGFSHDDDIAKPLPPTQPTPVMKPTRPSYDATLNDVRKMRRQAVVAAYKPFSLQRTSLGSTLRPRKSENFSGSSKPGSTTPSNEMNKLLEKAQQCKKSAGAVASDFHAESAQHRQSHHSLRGAKVSKSTLRSQSSSQLELRRSPTMIMHRSRSSIRQATQSASDNQSHVTTPLNVNINVFADKLKLLRV